jgi:tetratricopeptide (TPR) repeat protein
MNVQTKLFQTMGRHFRSRCFSVLIASAAVAVVSLGSSQASAIGDQQSVSLAHRHILQLDLDKAEAILKKLPENKAQVQVMRGLLAIYRGDCDGAATILHGVNTDNAGSLQIIARGCARVTASTVIVRDNERGIVVRLKDDEDAPLVPFLVNVAEAARATLKRDLGVELPKPLMIDLVRDQYSLAAMTGLPLKAAQTTGTVAVAKWGRVTMVSPRASAHGYSWADTLTHEMTHLAVTRASADRAPLWLQEGVAKREETRWRAPLALDEIPSSDAMSSFGFAHKMALDLDKLGPSIAMLPTPEQAMVAFSEVTSFIKYWAQQSGADALPQLLHGLADEEGDHPVDAVMKRVSKDDLASWSKRWKQYLETAPKELPAEMTPGGSLPNQRDLAKQSRLGMLLAQRDHHQQAKSYLQSAVDLAPHDPESRANLAYSLMKLNKQEEAFKVVDSLAPLHHASGLWFTMHGAFLRHEKREGEAREAFGHGIWLHPLKTEVACELLPSPQLPAEKIQATLCDALRNSRVH